MGARRLERRGVDGGLIDYAAFAGSITAGSQPLASPAPSGCRRCN